MKVIWEEIDIRGGRKFFKPGAGITGQHIVGYRIAIEHPDCPIVYGVVSLADGQFMQLGDRGTKAQVAGWLNDCGCYLPQELLP